MYHETSNLCLQQIFKHEFLNEKLQTLKHNLPLNNYLNNFLLKNAIFKCDKLIKMVFNLLNTNARFCDVCRLPIAI